MKFWSKTDVNIATRFFHSAALEDMREAIAPPEDHGPASPKSNPSYVRLEKAKAA